ncbi:MAG TPA: pentapeptide repeat-containing protein, partial [Acidimicrobiales bacterium]|nr:pentapeptide repeat-containing protein [Acidimicrobiales bacterium]
AAPNALADVVIGTCDFPSNPTPTDHAECAGDNLGLTGIGGLDADYADLSNTTLGSASNLAGGSFIDANFTGATWFHVGIDGADLSGADLTNANFGSGVQQGTNFTGATLHGTNIANGVFGGANFTGADLTDADFNGGQFGPSGNPDTFTGANLTDATFTDTKLVPANIITPATAPSGAAVTWPAPQTENGEQLGACSTSAGPVSSGATFAIGATTVTCEVTDTGTSTHGSGTFTVTVTPVAPTISGPSSAEMTTGTAGSVTFHATGYPTPGLTETGALPSGVTFTDNGDGTATLAGTPATGTAGQYPLTITASNGTSPDAVENVDLTVLAALAVTTTAVPSGTVGVAYHTTLAATGGTPPYSWSVASGSTLPPGLALAPDGTVSGTPTTEGTWRTTVDVASSLEAAARPAAARPKAAAAGATATLTFVIAPAPWSGPVATGLPDPAAKQAQGFYLGAHGEQWRLEVTQPHWATQTYQGTVTVNTGTFTDVQRVRLESSDRVSHSGSTLTFTFNDNSGVDGVSFVAPAAATSITFSLSIDGKKATASEVFLGKAPHGHPAGVPFSVHRTA